MQDHKEQLIKDKIRVQKHGEVFTPDWMVNKMLDTPGIKEACEDIEATFLEPAAGEGNFLVVILARKLAMVEKKYAQKLSKYCHYALYALSTLYAVELLDDNVSRCSINVFQIFKEHYQAVANKFGKKPQGSILNSAEVIISSNIQQGDFLTRLNKSGEPIIFSEWTADSLNKDIIHVSRTEYSLNEIYDRVEKPKGSLYSPEAEINRGQLSFFDELAFKKDNDESKKMKYARCLMTQVYREEKIPDEK